MTERTFQWDAEQISRAKDELNPFLRRTPVLASHSMPGVRFKAESLQRTGSFKVRPAFMQLLRLSAVERQRGLVTSSSGNFAQAAAWAAKTLGLDAKIVMMRSSSPVKIERTRSFGAQVVLCEDRFAARQEAVEALVKEEGRCQIYPYDHPLAILGNATVGVEILEQDPAVSDIVLPVSGGGLIAGVLSAIRAFAATVRVWGVQPRGSNATVLSFECRKPVSIERAQTIADGLSVTVPGRLTFPLVSAWAHRVVAVEEESIRRAVRLLFSEEKLVVEPSGAVTLAAVLEGKVPANSLCLLSGGNVASDLFAALIRESSPR